MYKINVGSIKEYKDNNDNLWIADQEYSKENKWGAIGGKIVSRDIDLPIDNKNYPELFRTERYGMKGYRFDLANGFYTVKLYFAETFERNFEAGKRNFDISVQENCVHRNFDPFTVSGKFARSAIIEIKGVSVNNNMLNINFTSKKGMINGIEISKTEKEPFKTEIIVEKSNTPKFCGTRKKLCENGKNYKILFIGNSGTFYWAIPESFSALLATGQNKINIEVSKRLSGGKRFSYHYKQAKTIQEIKSGKYDFVVIQGSSSEPTDFKDEMFKYGAKLFNVIREIGAKPILYAYKGNLSTTYEERTQAIDTYVELGQKYNVPVIPAVAALNEAIKERPDINYFNNDKCHLSMNGGYIMAYSFYAFFTQSKESHPCPAILDGQVPIPADIAEFIEDKVLEAIEKCPLYKLE